MSTSKAVTSKADTSKAVTTNATKVFTWASVASGKKQTQVEIEADRAKEREKQSPQERARLEKYEEEQLRKNLAKQKKEAEFIEKNAERLAQKEKQEKEHAEYYSREKGHWAKEVETRYEKIICPKTKFEKYRMLDVPRNVNERSLKYIQWMLVNYPEVTATCKTVGDFKKVFMEAYIAYAKKYYGEEKVEKASAFFAKFNGNSPNETFVEKGENLQGWAAYEEGLLKSAEAEFKRKGYGFHVVPPWVNKLWVFVKNVSFLSCLWAMNERSKTFEMETKTDDAFNTGFVRIASSTLPDDSTLTWLTDLTTYRGFPHKPKPVCKQKRDEEERREREEWSD